MDQKQEHQLAYLNDRERFNAYQTITQGCQHLWSKGKLDNDKLNNLLDDFIILSEKDPVFLAHLTSYVITKSDSKDLKVVSTFVNSLNDADGTPFYEGSKYRKPNYRSISQAAIQHLDPKLVSRIIQIANIKQSLGERYKEGTHFARSLKNAIKKYLRYREQNPKAMEGIKKAGFAKTVMNMYRAMHISPSTEAAEFLGWEQKDGRKIKKKKLFDFKGLSDKAIANKIRDKKIPPQGALGALTRKISPVIAASILEQCSGDQAVIYRELFDKEGLLKNKEVLEVFKEKIKTAKTALDRVDKITTEIDEEVSVELKKARSKRRKEIVGDIGRVFLHLDVSGSMDQAIEFAKERGSIIAECVKNPEENFHWGAFNSSRVTLQQPLSFEKDAFMASLYGIRAGGSTDCFAWYKKARELGCTTDVFITDQGHNSGPIGRVIEQCDSEGLTRPNAVIIINFENYYGDQRLKEAFEHYGIPVTEMNPETLTESALVAQAVQVAVRGAIAVIDDIMNTDLLQRPQWWNAV